MAELVIGTDSGVFRLAPNGGEVRPEEGPANVAFLAWDAKRCFAVTGEGALWEETDEGAWRLVNSRPVSEDVWAFGADPRMVERLYLGVSPALLYRSDDGGKSWIACDSIRLIPGYETWTFPPPPHIPHVRCIAPDPKAVGAVYIGVEEGGVYWSGDGGETWDSLNEGLNWDVHVVRPAADGTTLYATTGYGFHRSDDGGHHWRLIDTGLDRPYTIPLVESPLKPGFLYTAAAATPPPGWAQGANAALYCSNDKGQHWAQLEGGLPPRFDAVVRQMVVDDAGVVYAASGCQLFTSRDEGTTWQMVAGELPEIRALAVV